MNSTTPSTVRRRRRWPWVLLALMLAPIVVLGCVSYSYLTLDVDASLLRREMLRASGTEWKTKIQVSLGHISFAALRGGLSFSNDGEVIEVRDVLLSLRKTNGGVYQRMNGSEDWSAPELMTATDKRMQGHG